MASHMPRIPRFIFTVLEPALLIGGAVPAILWPVWFAAEQVVRPIPQSAAAAAASHDDRGNQLITGQLGNAYALFFLMAVMVFRASDEPRVVRNYLTALMIGDVGHLLVTYRVLGWDQFVAIGEWNTTTWGNIGITTFFLLARAGYLLGAFGSDAPVSLRPSNKVHWA